MNKTKHTSKQKAVYEARFVLLARPCSSEISKAEMFERMRTFPERAAKFLEKLRADKEQATL